MTRRLPEQQSKTQLENHLEQQSETQLENHLEQQSETLAPANLAPALALANLA